MTLWTGWEIEHTGGVTARRPWLGRLLSRARQNRCGGTGNPRDSHLSGLAGQSVQRACRLGLCNPGFGRPSGSRAAGPAGQIKLVTGDRSRSLSQARVEDQSKSGTR